ncbi:hypothetical protein DAPK24_020260 [Pichia kluyveri]|uniref:Uncharacterized protein n=1 Tax=Pichia kluyveri TaxID=36015 RepID=A0AAV5R1T4_PICKL|nr:hypothetical protein DAPK24_020260 [Pichia kluyveri]
MSMNDSSVGQISRDADPAYYQLLKRHSSPISPHHVNLINEDEINKEDEVNKLNQQVANLKRKQRNKTTTPSPRKKLCDDLRKSSSVSPRNKSRNNSSNKRVTINQLLNTLTPLFPDSPKKALKESLNHSTNNNNVNPLMDTQIITDSGSSISSTITTSNSSFGAISTPSSNTPTKIRKPKAGSINMFDSISKSDDISIEIPDSNETTSKDIEEDIKENNKGDISSSPMKKRVVFSSDIESSVILSSPIKPNNYDNVNIKSILKSTYNENNNIDAYSIENILKLDLGKNESWPRGFSLIIPADYPEIPRVIEQCSAGLINKNFKKKFEVYASFNELIKRKKSIDSNIFTPNILRNIIKSVKFELDLVVIELKNGLDPFKLRTTSQSLKLLALLSPLTTEIIEMKNIYETCGRILKNENITKSLTSPIFQLIRTTPLRYCQLYENFTITLIQMKFFPSCSIICEKFNIIKRFSMLYPHLLDKCSYQIINYLLYSIINTDVPGYNKILNTAIILLESIKSNNKNKLLIRNLLSEELETSLSSSSSLEEGGNHMTIYQAVYETLKYLAHIRLYKECGRIWSKLIQLVSFNCNQFEKWSLFQGFRSVFDILAREDEESIKLWYPLIDRFQNVKPNENEYEELYEKLSFISQPLPKLNDVCWIDLFGYFYKTVYPFITAGDETQMRIITIEIIELMRPIKSIVNILFDESEFTLPAKAFHDGETLEYLVNFIKEVKNESVYIKLLNYLSHIGYVHADYRVDELFLRNLNWEDESSILRVKNIDESVLFKTDGSEQCLFTKFTNLLDKKHLKSLIQEIREILDHGKVFAALLSSDIDDEDNIWGFFPDFIEYGDFKELEIRHGYKLCLKDQVNIWNHLQYLTSTRKLNEIMEILRQTNILIVSDTKFKFEFLKELVYQNRNKMKEFYQNISSDLLEHAFEYKEENEKTGNELTSLLWYFDDFKSLTNEWIESISNKLHYLIQPRLILDEPLIELIEYLTDKMETDEVNNLKRMMVERNVIIPGLFNDFEKLKNLVNYYNNEPIIAEESDKVELKNALERLIKKL